MKYIALLFGFFLSLSSSAEEVSIAGVYSSLEYHQRSGDIAGQEATILLTFMGLKIVTYCGPGVPVVVPLEKKDDVYYFELDESEEDSLCGHVENNVKSTKDHLLIWQEGSDTQKAKKLPRQPNYWVERNRVS